MMRFRLQILVCAIIASGGQLAYSADEDTKKLDRAKQLIDSGKPAAAKLILREVLRSNPGNADAHMQLGAALASIAKDDNYDEAIAEEQKAIQLDPKSFGARRILGMIYANQRKHDEAISLLQEACKISPTSFSGYRDLGATLLAAGKTEDAIAAWKKAAELKPENIAIHSKLATVLSKGEKYPEALVEAAKAVKLNESIAETHLLLANIKMQSGDAAGAVESFKTAIEANGFDSFGSKNPMTAAGALSGLGWALTQSNKDTEASLSEAVTYQRKAIKADPRFLPAYVRLSELLAKQNKTKEAEALYKRIFASSQFNPTVGVSYAKFLASSNRKEDARIVLKQVLEKSPENKQATDAVTALDK